MVDRKCVTAFYLIIFGTAALFAQTGNYKWNNPGTLPSGCTHGTYHSGLMNIDIGYNIWLPPDYNGGTERYPVVYSLHGMGGNEGSNCQTFAGVLQNGVSSNAFPPIIMVFVCGRGNTFYSDSKDGAVKCESSMISELIPFIDSTYRTKTDRTQRAIEGVSMGGFGALMLGFKHPDVFGSIGSYDAALVNWDTLSEQQFDQSIPKSIFGSDRNYFNDNSYPFTFAKKNAATIKSLGIKVRMITGDNDVQMGPLHSYNLAMRDTLKALGIPIEMKIIAGGTHGAGMNATTGKENMIFHTGNFKAATTPVAGFSIHRESSGSTHAGTFMFSSFYLPGEQLRYAGTVALYDLSGRRSGRVPRDGAGGRMGGNLSSGRYLFNVKY